MDRVRDICSSGLGLRRAEKIRVRQPLRRLTVAGADLESLRPFLGLIRDEVNVKEVELSSEIEHYATFRLQVNARALGKRLGAKMQEVIRDSKRGLWQKGPGGVEVAGEVLGHGDFELLLRAKEGVTCQALPSNDAVVILDLELDEELEQEGRARDLVRLVQQARKEADLHVSDRIHLVLKLPPKWAEAAEHFRDYVAEQTLARRLELGDRAPPAGFSLHETELGDASIQIGLAKLS